MIAAAGAWLVVGFAFATAPQEPAPTEPTAPPVAAPAAEVARAEAVLAAHAARSRGAKVIAASYVQRRTTELLREPLVSRGEFVFVREPAAVVFRASEPRVSIVRLTATTYEVHRPQKKQLERTFLDGPELASGLFAAVGGDADRLRREFVVVGCRDAQKREPPTSEPASEPAREPPQEPENAGGAKAGAKVDAPADVRVVVRLVGKEAALRERLRELVLTLRERDGALVALAYRDQAGDLIEIELTDVRLDPKDPPRAELDLAEGTTIVEHRIAPRRAK